MNNHIYIYNKIDDKIDENLNEKIKKINSTKDELFTQIKDFENNLLIDEINKNLEDHKICYHFSKTMKIYEYYNWKKIKLDYSNIKKRITLHKKLYSKIINIYTNIINYFNQDEISIINDKIIILQNDNQTINYNYTILNQKHNEIINTCKYLIKNKQVIKIYNLNITVEPIIKKIYELYYNIKQVNKQIQLLKSTKNNINNEILFIIKQLKNIKL